jgi:hypothetical protein
VVQLVDHPSPTQSHVDTLFSVPCCCFCRRSDSLLRLVLFWASPTSSARGCSGEDGGSDPRKQRRDRERKGCQQRQRVPTHSDTVRACSCWDEHGCCRRHHHCWCCWWECWWCEWCCCKGCKGCRGCSGGGADRGCDQGPVQAIVNSNFGSACQGEPRAALACCPARDCAGKSVSAPHTTRHTATSWVW